MTIREITLAVAVAVALLVGFIVAWWLRGRLTRSEVKGQIGDERSARERAEQKQAFFEQRLKESQQEQQELQEQVDGLVTDRGRLQSDCASLQSTDKANKQRMGEIINERDKLTNLTDELREQNNRLKSDVRSQRVEFEEQRNSLDQQIKTLEDAHKKLSEQFENIANRIFESKSESFRKSSAEQLQNLLKPFREQIDGLHKDVREASKERSTLGTQIKEIVTQADALTNALKSDTKQQGDWGEVVLERILENSGLRKGEEYEVQPSFTDGEGKRFRPDVIVHMPEERDIVIDSKVSITAYERYVNGEGESEQQAQLKAHVQSVRRHMEELAGKRYDHIESIHTVDYILMWVPLEPAYFAAMQADPSLMNLAMEKRVIPVCATTLFAVLKTVERVWRYERQNNNVQEIIERASQLYDKFRNFTESLDEVGTHLNRARNSYQTARSRLTDGRGNVVRQVEMLREMGVSPRKKLSAEWADAAHEEGLEEPESKAEGE